MKSPSTRTFLFSSVYNLNHTHTHQFCLPWTAFCNLVPFFCSILIGINHTHTTRTSYPKIVLVSNVVMHSEIDMYSAIQLIHISSLEQWNMNWTNFPLKIVNIHGITRYGNNNNNGTHTECVGKKWTTANNMDHAYFWFDLWRKRYRCEVALCITQWSSSSLSLSETTAKQSNKLSIRFGIVFSAPRTISSQVFVLVAACDVSWTQQGYEEANTLRCFEREHRENQITMQWLRSDDYSKATVQHICSGFSL